MCAACIFVRVAGVTVFTRPTAAPEPAAGAGAGAGATIAAAGAAASGSDLQRRPVLGDRVTVSKQPRNADFLQPGQVGTVVEVDDMDVEDVWFTVEDADGETDEYCEADLVIAGTDAVADLIDEPRVVTSAASVVSVPAPVQPAPAEAVSAPESKKTDAGGFEIAASAQKMMAQSKVKGLFDDSDDSDGGGGLFD